jgi:hypothetical protein
MPTAPIATFRFPYPKSSRTSTPWLSISSTPDPDHAARTMARGARSRATPMPSTTKSRLLSTRAQHHPSGSRLQGPQRPDRARRHRRYSSRRPHLPLACSPRASLPGPRVGARPFLTRTRGCSGYRPERRRAWLMSVDRSLTGVRKRLVYAVFSVTSGYTSRRSSAWRGGRIVEMRWGQGGYPTPEAMRTPGASSSRRI